MKFKNLASLRFPNKTLFKLKFECCVGFSQSRKEIGKDYVFKALGFYLR